MDVALELIGLPLTMQQSIEALDVLGRAVIVGLSDQLVEIETYRNLLGKEAEIIGSSDHLASELPILTELVQRGELDLADVITNTVPLDADAINETMDRLESFEGEVRTVIVP